MLSDYIIPGLILLLFIIMTARNMPSYDIFIDGAKKAVGIAVNVFPYLATVLLMVELMKVSGLSDIIASALTPFFSAFGIPGQLAELIIIRPFSGSATLAVYNNILATHGPDSYISRCASVIMGSSETVFYIATVYFASKGVKRLRYGIPVSLVAMLVGIIASCLLCRIM